VSPRQINPGCIVSGPTLPEPIEVLAVVPMGASLKIIGRGRSTGLTHDPVLTPAQLEQLTVSAEREPFDGNARLFRLGVEAHRLGLAYEYDPFFSLSIARVDPLPHQLEAVYGYFMRLPRIRFLLADDPGAGKTIMAGLLLKELKARGLVRRALIVCPANLTFQWQRELSDKFRERLDEHQIADRIVRDVSPERFRAITENALEGLAKKDLNLSAIVGKSAEAKERRLVPEVVESFFLAAAPESGLTPKETAKSSRVFRIGKVPRNLIPIGDRQESRFGRLGREYRKIVFDKALLPSDPTLEWVTPGHPLFEAVRTDCLARCEEHLRRGGVFYDLHRAHPALLDVFAASIKDGRGSTLHRRLFVIETSPTGEMRVHEPTIFHEVSPAPAGTPTPASVEVPDRTSVEQFLYQRSLEPWIASASQDRMAEVARVAAHVDISLNSLIDRQQLQLAEFLNRQITGQTVPGLDGIIAQAEQHLDELNNRLEGRRRELELERHCIISDIAHIGRAWVLPHPERTSPQLAPMIADPEIERIAVQEAIRYEEARGCVVESVESENRGFDLISRRPHPEDPKSFIEVRFIEVKGRAGVGVVALSENEYRTAERLKCDYWLYAVFNCAGTPQLHAVQDPARLGWQPVVTVEHYQLAPHVILQAQNGQKD
jgi:hypothetical protein